MASIKDMNKYVENLLKPKISDMITRQKEFIKMRMIMETDATTCVLYEDAVIRNQELVIQGACPQLLLIYYKEDCATMSYICKKVWDNIPLPPSRDLYEKISKL